MYVYITNMCHKWPELVVKSHSSEIGASYPLGWVNADESIILVREICKLVREKSWNISFLNF